MTNFITTINDTEFTIEGEWEGDRDEGYFTVESVETESGYILSESETDRFVDRHENLINEKAADQIELDNQASFYSHQKY